MEKLETKKNNRLAPTLILLFVLVSVALIMVEMAANVSGELETQAVPEIVEHTVVPTAASWPTFEPGYTPSFMNQ